MTKKAPDAKPCLPVDIGELDIYLFGQGQHWDLYRILGAHPHDGPKGPGYRFAVWAPNAKGVSVVGDFNDWAPETHTLYPVAASGVWAGYIPGLAKGELYKYAVIKNDGHTVLKTDPFALCTEIRPGVAARTWDLDGHGFHG